MQVDVYFSVDLYSKMTKPTKFLYFEIFLESLGYFGIFYNM